MLSQTILFATVAAGLAGVTTAQYSLVDNYDASNFFREFDFFSDADPTHGFVQYKNNITANRDGLAGYVKDSIYMGVDHTNVYTTATGGRPSVRLTSKKAYTHGLFIADIPHMPAGVTNGCGLWPAYWMFGPNWPTSGEIDILEGVNSRTTNQVTLHTSDGCEMSATNALPGANLIAANCESGTGCGQTTQVSNSYGPGFNAIGGGVYAMEWTSTTIKVWFFARDTAMAKTLASNGSNAAPDLASFGTPLAAFAGNDGCNIDQHFVNHNIVFDTTFCGDWAGQAAVWNSDSTCAALAPTCNDYVGNNPQEYTDAYWLVNSVKVYQQGGTKSARRHQRSFSA